MTTAAAIRNVAIIAHVDHGKTTLVDSLLTTAGALGADHEACVLDSNPLERERGITIFSKNCAIDFLRGDEQWRINLIDTPGHADFGGEVERVLRMADGALILVDAHEGPRPQTRFVLTKALELDLRLIVVVNKCDRPDARPNEVVDEVFDLLDSLGASDETLEFETIFASGRDGWAVRDLETDERSGVKPLLDAMVDHLPAPTKDPEAPLRLLITTLDYSEYVGRIAIGRVESGTIRAGQPIIVCGEEGKPRQARALKVHRFNGLGRGPVDEVIAGDLCAVEGLEKFDIGDTICQPDHPDPLPRVAVDEPTVNMVFRINDSPFAGREGDYVTSRQISARLDKELQSNVALRVEPGDSADEFRVSGRGLLHIGVLIENMRREGFELAIGRPQVVEREVDGAMCEPIESLTLDLAASAMGPALELLGQRGGEILTVEPRGDRTFVEAEIPARGLLGLRSRLLTATGGEAVMEHAFLRWAPVRSVPRGRGRGVLVGLETGQATAYSLQTLSERAVMFVKPGEETYAGQVVGENSRENDLDVNVARAKAFSNVRESTKEATVTLKAPRSITLESALEYIEEDELVEVTPNSIRLRKRMLSEADRRRANRRARERAEDLAKAR